MKKKIGNRCIKKMKNNIASGKKQDPNSMRATAT